MSTNRSAHDSRMSIERSSIGRLANEGTLLAHFTAMKSNFAADSKIASLLHRRLRLIGSLVVDWGGVSELVTSSSLTAAIDSLKSSGDCVGETNDRPKSRSVSILTLGESRYGGIPEKYECIGADGGGARAGVAECV